MERRILKDFHIGSMEYALETMAPGSKDIFTHLANAMGRKKSSKRKQDWNNLVRKNTLVHDPIGSSQELEQLKKNRESMRKQILANSGKIDSQQLLGGH